MDAVVNPYPQISFDFEEKFRGEEVPLPYPAGVDPKTRYKVCPDYENTHRCPRGNRCTQLHPRADKMIVCKHYMRGLCKKAIDCEFLHFYDLSLMPECYFFSTYGECSNPDCVYLHCKPEERLNECPYYKRGFCPDGPKCVKRHVKRELCLDYMRGFCALGPLCEQGHPKYEPPTATELEDSVQVMSPAAIAADGPRRTTSSCFLCGRAGHLQRDCPTRNSETVLRKIPTRERR
jgi:cleavage and polyadenylation specificity factor subunit 4